ncbi:MAG: hypothetical protein ABEJ72_02920, partial [Candidatus Aenigmatarchaeota archaeon]
MHKVVNAPRQRFLVADDVGLGKTIEAGMVLKELDARFRASIQTASTPNVMTWYQERSEEIPRIVWGKYL